MNQVTIYLDNAATTQPDPVVVAAINESLSDLWGNPSSSHDIGRRARVRLDEARTQIAKRVQCHDDEVFFTSGGTEADNWAILGVLDYWQSKRNHIITVSTEHHAIIDVASWCRKRGYEVTILPVDSEGRLDPQAVRNAITSKTAIVSVMHVNNELGTIQEVAEIGAICREHEVIFHTDCVQSFGKLPLNFRDLNADLASLSSHKIYGPKGVGALLVRRGVRISPRFIGGSQERGLRTGTENVPGIVGFGKAAEISGSMFETEIERIKTLRDRLEKEVLDCIPDVVINGSREHRSPGILNISFSGCEGEALMMALDMKGICVSTGSACSAGAIGASHVLIALGMDPILAQASLRFSVGRFNSSADIDAMMSVLPQLVEKQRQMAPSYLRG
jgi:cysteine desulfurase